MSYFDWPTEAVELVESLTGEDVARQLLDRLGDFVDDAVERARDIAYESGYDYGRSYFDE